MRISSLSREKRILALIIGAILICAIGSAAYLRAHKEYTATISLAYQNASSGMYPDGMRFDPYLATSDDVRELLGYK